MRRLCAATENGCTSARRAAKRRIRQHQRVATNRERLPPMPFYAFAMLIQPGVDYALWRYDVHENCRTVLFMTLLNRMSRLSFVCARRSPSGICVDACRHDARERLRGERDAAKRAHAGAARERHVVPVEEHRTDDLSVCSPMRPLFR